MVQVTVFSGAQRQRRWSEGEKPAMAEAAFAQGAIVSVVAQRFDVAGSQLYRWRRVIGDLDRAASFCDFARVNAGPILGQCGGVKAGQ